VKRGDTVEWFGASFPGAPSEETIDGVRIVRGGRQWTVHWRAYRRYRRNLSTNFDIVVDEVNTVPFFTPLWANVPIVMFIHQLAREVWWYESPFPISVIGFLVEPRYLRFYRHIPVVTVSESTKRDLLGLHFKGQLTVAPEGLEPVTESRIAKETTPTFLYVGRLTPSKRVSDVIEAFALFCNSVSGSELNLLGEGPPNYVNKLHTLVLARGVAGRVNFLGRVSTERKHQEMARATMLLLASVREGWGLVVTEANAFGTPAIAYDVPGLRDSIRDQETGVLVKASPQKLADAMLSLWAKPDQYQSMSAAASEWSATFSFDNTASAFREELARVSEMQSGTRRSPS
jgi:glycosyltransferase involved in cell wall biosynthesis